MKNTCHDVWKQVTKRSEDECWLYTGYVSPDGYGHITINYKDTQAHAAAFISVNGPVTSGKLVMHQCNVRSCCNPKHLKKGTHSDNSQYAMKCGAWKPGISGVLGVRYDKKRNRYIASARFEGKRVNLYQGHSLEAATLARKTWEEETRL